MYIMDILIYTPTMFIHPMLVGRSFKSLYSTGLECRLGNVVLYHRNMVQGRNGYSATCSPAPLLTQHGIHHLHVSPYIQQLS